MEQTPARGWHETAPQQDWLAATTTPHARTRGESQHGMTINANAPQPLSCERRWPNSCSCGVPWLLQRSCAQIPKAVTQPPHPAPVGNSLCQPRFPGFRSNSGQDTSQHCEGRTARVVATVWDPVGTCAVLGVREYIIYIVNIGSIFMGGRTRPLLRVVSSQFRAPHKEYRGLHCKGSS